MVRTTDKYQHMRGLEIGAFPSEKTDAALNELLVEYAGVSEMIEAENVVARSTI